MSRAPIDTSKGILKCLYCGQEKPISSFVKESRKKSGVRRVCLECARDQNRKRYYADHEHQKELVRLRSKRNPRKHRYTKVGEERSGIYIIEMKGVFKIGMSSNVHERIRQIIGSLPYHGDLVAIIETQQARIIESELHKEFIEKRLNGEWFSLDHVDLKKIRARYG